jgi:hypothetical protein
MLSERQILQLQEAMEDTTLHRASVAFPLQHTFVDADHCGDPTRYLIRANMTKFVAFLSESVELPACPFRVIMTTKNRPSSAPRRTGSFVLPRGQLLVLLR